MAWRAADSLSIRQFLDVALHEAPPDHSTLSRTRRLIDVETHHAVFTWVLQRLADAHLVEGHPIGIDATTLEANAAMRSIVRRDTGDAYAAWLTRLAEASGLATPTRAELARFRSDTEEERVERRLDASARSRCEDHEDEGRPHAPGAYGRARRRPGDRRDRGRDGPGCGRRGHAHDGRDPHHGRRAGGGGVAGWGRRGRGRRRQGVSPQRDDGRVCRDRRAELRLGAGPGAAQLEGQGRGPQGGVCESSAHTGRARETIAAAAGRAAGTPQCASLRDRAAAPRASARTSQHPEARARPCLRFQSRVAHAAADGRRHAAEPPRPRGGPSWRPDRPPGRALGAWAAILGPGAPRSTGFVVGRPGDTSIRTHDPRFTNSPFCHGLLRNRRRRQRPVRPSTPGCVARGPLLEC